MAVAFMTLMGFSRSSEPSTTSRSTDNAIRWPDGTDTLHFTNVEGVILIRSRLVGSRRVVSDRMRSGEDPGQPADARNEAGAVDTTGWFALDTGAGFLAVDWPVAFRLGIVDSVSTHSIDIAPRPLPRIEIGDLTADQIAPVLVFDAGLLSRVTDRDVLGLIGYRLLRDRVVWIDYGTERVALVPAGENVELEDAMAVAASRRTMGNALSPAAIPSRFRMIGDGKILVRARITPIRGGRTTPWLNLVLDTGASKSTLFEDIVDSLSQTRAWRPVLRGMAAPTLFAVSTARLCRVRQIEVRGTLGTATATQTEVALLRNPLARQLGDLAGEPVHGLLGYSFLRHFRVACDYPRRVLWLDPVPSYREPHPYEHTHVGLQLERTQGTIRVAAVVEESPAAKAGIAAGDELIAVGGKSVAKMEWAEIERSMEGPPGTGIDMTLRRGETEKTYHLRRRRLL